MILKLGSNKAIYVYVQGEPWSKLNGDTFHGGSGWWSSL